MFLDYYKYNIDYILLDNLDFVISNFINFFCTNISNNNQNDIHYWEYLSFGLNIKEGFKARKAFDSIKKNHYYVFWDYYRYSDDDLLKYKNKVFKIYTWNKLKTRDFFDYDMYIIDINFQWVYIITHENDIGPFFVNL